jgi:hypothetical protein
VDKLKAVALDFKDANQVSELQKGMNVHTIDGKSSEGNFKLEFNQQTGNINVFTPEQAGTFNLIKETQAEPVVPVVPATETAPAVEEQPVSAEVPIVVPQEETAAPTEMTEVQRGNRITYLTPEEIEQQRDIAFKIVYFFIAFIIMTFGLLYAYYKVDQKEQERERRVKTTKNIFYDEPNQKTFFDFLAGQVEDENYLVNPNARKSLVQNEEKNTIEQLKTQSTFYQN